MRLNELEIKISLDTTETLQRTYANCVRLYGKPVSHFHQLDEYYDTANGQLKQQDLVLRVRTVDGKQSIALKSPRSTLPSGMTHRIELEFAAADAEEIEMQLAAQALAPYEASEKKRWTFVANDCEVVIDILPVIGAFVEVEGPSEEAIMQIVDQLELKECAVMRHHYGELIKAKFQQLQLPTDQILATFCYEQQVCQGELSMSGVTF